MAGSVWRWLSTLDIKEQAAIIAACIALGGVLLNVLITALMTRKTQYLNTVTAERSKWIEKLRNNIANFAGLVRYFHFRSRAVTAFYLTEEYKDLIKQIEQLIPLINLQLNRKGRPDRNISTIIDRMPHLAEHEGANLLGAQWLLIAHSQWLLKAEWEKVKAESKRLLGLSGWIKKNKYRWEYARFCKGEGSLSSITNITD
jgi:hypothetical protein